MTSLVTEVAEPALAIAMTGVSDYTGPGSRKAQLSYLA